MKFETDNLKYGDILYAIDYENYEIFQFTVRQVDEEFRDIVHVNEQSMPVVLSVHINTDYESVKNHLLNNLKKKINKKELELQGLLNAVKKFEK